MLSPFFMTFLEALPMRVSSWAKPEKFSMLLRVSFLALVDGSRPVGQADRHPVVKHVSGANFKNHGASAPCQNGCINLI